MSYRILIVDDSATTRALVKRIIRMAEVPASQLLEAPNGHIALELLAAAPVDLILADLNMPEMDGFEMIRRLRADEALRHIPIVVLSASPSGEEFAGLEQVNGFVGKPFSPESIRQVILKALEVQHA
jgi:two-component system chemotaxis response regulator CheY